LAGFFFLIKVIPDDFYLIYLSKDYKIKENLIRKEQAKLVDLYALWVIKLWILS